MISEGEMPRNKIVHFRLLTMSLRNKIIVIVGFSAAIVGVAFVTSKPQPAANPFKTVFEAIMMIGLLSFIIAVNFFAISFFVRRIVRWLRN